MTKKELEQKIKLLEDQLSKELSRPVGHTIQNCSIDMDHDDRAIAIAKAVKEGMKALQDISKSNSYGIYFGRDK